MIEILPIRDKQKINELYFAENLTTTEFSMAVEARCGEEMLGYCLFDLKDCIVVRSLTPENDPMLADGILRSALHVSVENNVLEAFWADNISEDLLKKLDFVDDLKEKRLRIKKLFESCRGCGK